MMQFGLLEKVAKGEIRASQAAVDILHPDKPSDRTSALLRAAFAPPLFKTLKDRFPDDRFSEDALRSFLMREGFLERAISPVLSAYSETIAFLQQEKATESGGASVIEDAESDPPDETTYGGASVGDLIQWESGGALQFEKPRRVRQISEDGLWVAVDGSSTGIPMNEVVVETKGAKPPSPPPVFALDVGTANEVKLANGEREWLRGPLSKEASYRLIVAGDLGPKEIGKLIKLLKAQQAVLSDEDEDDEAAH
jgi:hypothetical protein